MLHRITLCSFCLYAQVFCVLTTEITLRGSQYISYNIKPSEIRSKKNILSFRFKTIHPSGLLIYSRGSTWDYIQLELIQGALKYTAYPGGVDKTEIQLGKDLFNGKWHTVSVNRNGRLTMLSVDDLSTTKITPGPYDHLNLDGLIFIGGLSVNTKNKVRIKALNYRGCLSDIVFDRANLLDGAQKALGPAKTPSPYQIYGNVLFQCDLEDYRPVSFLTPQSFVKVTLPKLPQDNDTFSASFKFRTFHHEGIIFSRSAIKVKLNIRLHSGVLMYDVLAPNGSKAELRMGENLNDGEWHSVNASIVPPNVQLTLDDRTRSKFLNLTSLLLDFSNKSRLKIFAGRGAREYKFPGFVGCMLNLRIDSHKITARHLSKQKYSNGIDATKCATSNRCFPNPCINRGTCWQDWQSFYCDCSNTYFEGKRCELPIYKPTCEHYKSLGLKRDAHCLLDSDEDGPEGEYTALCNVTDPSRSYTVLQHNKETRVAVDSGSRINRQYIHKITYNAVSEAQITALIRQSKKCRQLIRFDCIKSKLLNSPSGPSHAFWRPFKSNKLQSYWGGAIPGSGACACGNKGTPSSCDNPSKLCNCDIRDNEWRTDEGYFTNKELLPVTELQFHEKSARSYFTLGALECWGRHGKNEDVHTSVVDLIDRVCHPVIEPPPPSTTTKKTIITTLTTMRICAANDPLNDCIYNYSTTLPTHPWIWPPMSTSTPDYGTGEADQQRKKDITVDNGLSMPAIVLISCAMIIMVLLLMRFVLPRIIVCVRTHSKRGEYIVPPAVAGTGYAGRLMPLVASKRGSGRARAQYRLEDGKLTNHETNNINASGGIKSYWV
ncbi:predicted protein [Nematostella vectensis]|uniref:Uncharacterized protein n=1 Tax=Nematostella vectensis TaxID=45351 RepID=A7SAQ7_NEMVE|nr:predicted protein [Nematostella vectensis]|eukprot:XP_001631324.1 predicted protein [Nematostella vectensis]